MRAAILLLLQDSCDGQNYVRQIQAQLILHNTTQTPESLNTSSARANHTAFSTLLLAFSHSQNQTPHNPLFIYTRMRFNSVLPNNFTFPPLFKSLSDTRHVTQAQCVHTHVLKLGHHQDLCVRNSILDVYASSGHVALHRQLFDEMPHRDLRDALVVFEQMQYAGFVPNRVTMINALHACAHYGNVEMWAWIRGVIKREGWELDMVLGMALIDMYAKCGREKNVFTWNAVIKGLALAKSGQEAIWCANCVQSLGFGGQGSRDFWFVVHGMYFGPTKAMWRSLMSGSKAQGDLELALLAARKLIELEPDNTAYYIHLSNLYAVMGRWSDVEKERGLMKDRQLTKDSGCSSVEVEHQSHVSELLA
ncbi:hypothetical protein AAZV13_03G171300 [Glycine max]